MVSGVRGLRSVLTGTAVVTHPTVELVASGVSVVGPVPSRLRYAHDWGIAAFCGPLLADGVNGDILPYLEILLALAVAFYAWRCGGCRRY